MATYWLPSSNGYYDTNNEYVKYRIRIIENSFNSSARTENITIQAYFYRTNTGYTTDYTHTLYYKINGTEYSFSNAYNSYPITNSGVYMNSKIVDVPVNDDGTVSVTVYCKYISTNSSNLTTDYNGGSISLTKQTARAITVTFYKNDGTSEYVKETFTYGVSNQSFGHNSTGSCSNHSGKGSSKYGETGQFGQWNRTGYKLLGWATNSTATSAEYSTYSGVNDWWIDTYSPSINLYAVWEARPSQNVYIYDDGTIYARGYFTSSSIYIDSTGAIYAPAFTIGSSIYISSSGIVAKAFKEGTP